MATRTLPGLVDVHVHVRDFEQAHKEDWASASAAALAGGVVTILAMPNTKPSLTDAPTLQRYAELASHTSRCDFGLHAGANVYNAQEIAKLASACTGLKLYLDATFGELRMDTLDALVAHMDAWPHEVPLLVHAEGRTMAAALLVAHVTGRSVHVCHVSRRAEIELIDRAKQRGLDVTAEVCPHHLFLDERGHTLQGGYCEVRPVLATPDDVAALWQHLEAIDVIATDHAPHTPEEKQRQPAPPGFPGLETMLPLLLGAVHEGRLEWDTLVDKCALAPRRLFALDEPPETRVVIDVDASWEIEAAKLRSKCGWTPFEGRTVRGRVLETWLRGQRVFDGEQVLAVPGFGRNVRGGQEGESR